LWNVKVLPLQIEKIRVEVVHDSLRMLTRSALTPVVYAILYPGAFLVLLLNAGLVMVVMARRKTRMM
jgi:hypothetical protein